MSRLKPPESNKLFSGRPQRPGSSPLSPAGLKSPPRTPNASYTHSRQTSADDGGEQAKRLVEQFFRVDGKSKPSRLSDNAYLFGAPLRPETPMPDSWEPSDGTESAQTTRNGAVTLKEIDTAELAATDLADDMMNIDSGARTLPLEVVEQQLARVAEQLRQPRGETLAATRSQLREVEAYLRQMRARVEQVAEELRGNEQVVKKHYVEELQRSGDKVASLRQLLDTVGECVARARGRVNQSKDVLASDVAEKIRVLDYVRTRFAEHDRVQRRRRLRQISVALAVAVVVAGVYCSMR